MGSLVAQLHGLAIAVDEPVARRPGDDGDDWSSLAAVGASRHAPWASVIAENLQSLQRAAAVADSAVDHEQRIGSHRDLNAHNVLFDGDRLVLVDWDAAGPASARAERAEYSVLWAYTADGAYDIDTAVAFLRGYCDAGGTVDRDDPAALPCGFAVSFGGLSRTCEWPSSGPLTRKTAWRRCS